MADFTPDEFPREPQNRTLVWGEHDLQEVIEGELDQGDSVESMGFHITSVGPEALIVTPDGYAKPVATFEADDYNTPLHLVADLSAWSTMVWAEMDCDQRAECFLEVTEDPERKDDPDTFYSGVDWARDDEMEDD